MNPLLIESHSSPSIVYTLESDIMAVGGIYRRAIESLEHEKADEEEEGKKDESSCSSEEDEEDDSESEAETGEMGRVH